MWNKLKQITLWPVSWLLNAGAFLALLAFYFRKPYTTFGPRESLAFYVALFVFTGALIETLLGNFAANKETRLKARLLYISVFVALAAAEITLRIMGVNQTYPEARSGKYYSPFNEHRTDLQRRPGIGYEYALQTPEYSYARKGNNYGYSDIDFAPRKPTDSVLIQTYGDSFTEGDGAPFDSSYPARLRQLLPPGYVVQNYGLCGNDPAFYLYELKDCGAQFKPDVAVMCYGTGDFLVDFFTRGGLERFKGTYWQAREGKSWEWIYAASFISRPFFQSWFNTDYGKFLFSENEYAAELKVMQPKWNEMFKAVAQQAARNHVKVLLFKKPERSEVMLNKYDYDLSFFETMADTMANVYRVDLLPYYRDSAGLTEQNINNYYWLHDGHHNATGYGVMAKGIRSALRTKLHL